MTRSLIIKTLATSVLSALAFACGANDADPDSSAAALTAPTCAASASQALDLAKRIAPAVVAEKATGNAESAADTQNELHQDQEGGAPEGPSASDGGPASKTKTPSATLQYCDRVAGNVTAKLGDLQLQVLTAVRACPSISDRIRTEAEFASVRAALKETLTLSAAIGALKPDGTGLKAALDAGVMLYGRSRNRSMNRIWFARGQADAEILVPLPPQPAADGQSSVQAYSWHDNGHGAYTVSGNTVSVGSERFVVSATAQGIVLTSGKSAYYDAPVECLDTPDSLSSSSNDAGGLETSPSTPGPR